MRTPLRILATLLIAVLAVGAVPANAAETGQIVGTVTDVATKKPIANASVSAASLSDTYHTKTDAKGNYVFSDVTSDTYTISVEAQGYFSQSSLGNTVVPGQSYRADITLSISRTIAITHARGVTSPFQPTQPIDVYNLGSDQIATFVGKDFNTSGQRLLATLPSVTVDRQGTPLIRGGFSFQLGYDVEGIDYREPSRSLTNRFQNFGNSNSINGVGNVEVIPGGGDATHGDTGTGLISITIKRGTQKPYATLDFEGDGRGGYRQFAFEDSRWLGRTGDVSNYFSYVGSHDRLQYGAYGTDAGSLGASRIASDPNATSNLNAHTGSLYTTAYYNPQDQDLNDVIDNLVVKFGKHKQQSLQFFFEQQVFAQQLNYGGLPGVSFASSFPPGSSVGANSTGSPFGPIGNIFAPAVVGDAISRIYPAFPYGSPGTALTTLDQVRSPFNAFKVDFRSPLGANGSMDARYYRTLNSQTEYLAEQGIYSPQNGGIRTGVQLDLAQSLGGGKHFLQFGGKYEFVHPSGTTFDTVDYSPAFAGLGAASGFQISTSAQTDIVPDFITPSPTGFDDTLGNNALPISGTPGCNGNLTSPGGTPVTNGYNCGFLSRFFPNGHVPRIPAEVEIPTANEQDYALYGQETYAPNSRLKILAGVRLDGYNFVLPSDPLNPPALDGLRQQREYEPHLGLAYKIGNRDAIRANFGTTLSIPLPTFLGLDIDRNAYSAFANVPSYDNSKGPFDPTRPLATQATYCGPGVPQTTTQGTTIVQGTQPCANYADQIYWLYRNYRFGLQSLFKFPLRGSTFTNADLSYSHEFADGTAVRITPFARRGYDIVETSRTLLGFDPVSEVADLSPEIYSNQGSQSASGIELYLAKTLGRKNNGAAAAGISYQVAATYVNQIGNDPPGTFLPTPSVLLGERYPSPSLARFQATLGLTFRTNWGLRVNPILSLKSGYPYGAGVPEALFYGNLNTPLYIPLTNAIANGLVPNYCNTYASAPCTPAAGSLPSNGAVDPQNPGTVTNPTIIASRGTEGLTAAPGSLRSPASANLDVFIELRPLNSALTYGFGITNLFDQLSDVPVVNAAEYLIPISGGSYYNTGHTTGTAPTHSDPFGLGQSYHPYIVYPNQTPLEMRAYLQLHL